MGFKDDEAETMHWRDCLCEERSEKREETLMESTLKLLCGPNPTLCDATTEQLPLTEAAEFVMTEEHKVVITNNFDDSLALQQLMLVEREDGCKMPHLERLVEKDDQSRCRATWNDKVKTALTETLCRVKSESNNLSEEKKENVEKPTEELFELIEADVSPMVVVGVVGLYRTGKSYILNLLAGRMKGFGLGSTTADKTDGFCLGSSTESGRRVWFIKYSTNPKRRISQFGYKGARPGTKEEKDDDVDDDDPDDDDGGTLKGGCPLFLWAVRDFTFQPEGWSRPRPSTASDQYLETVQDLEGLHSSSVIFGSTTPVLKPRCIIFVQTQTYIYRDVPGSGGLCPSVQIIDRHQREQRKRFKEEIQGTKKLFTEAIDYGGLVKLGIKYKQELCSAIDSFALQSCTKLTLHLAALFESPKTVVHFQPFEPYLLQLVHSDIGQFQKKPAIWIVVACTPSMEHHDLDSCFYERPLKQALGMFPAKMAVTWLVWLLLTLANDVETNPGPTGGAMASQGDLCILNVPATIHIQTPEARSKRQSSPSVGKIRNEVVTQTNKADSPLRKRMLEYYGLTLLIAKDGFKENNMEFSFRNRTRKDGEKLVKELEDMRFGRLVSSLLKLHPAPKSWELIPSVDKEKSEYYLSRCPQQDSGFGEDEVEGRSPSSPTEQTTDLYGAARSSMKSPSFTPAAEMVPPPSRVQSSSLPPESRKFQEPLLPGISGSPVTMPARVASPFSVINKVIIELLKSKKHTEYDLHQMLKTHSKQIVPLLMLDENGFNMLHQCVEQNRIPLLKVFHVHGYWAELIEQEVPRGSSSEFAGCTPRQMAERKRLRRVVKELERITQQEKSMDGKNASLRACRSGNVELLRQMKASGQADMKAKDSEENNAVHWAATSGSLEAVKYLTRELNIRPDLKNEIKQTPLHLAVIYGRSSVVSFLAVECKLDAGATDKSEKTPLQRTAENGDTSTLSELLKCNVEIDTSLGVIAAQFGRQNYLQHVLASYGIDHLYRNNEGKTCLMVAAESGHLEIVKFLLNTYNYNLNDVSNQRRNVFHYAADKGHADVAKFLLEKGHSLGLIPEILNRKDLHRVEQLCSLVRGIDKGRAAWHYVKLKRKYVHLFQKCTKGGRVDASKVGTILQSGWGQEPDLEILKKAVERYKETGRTTEGQEDLTPLLLAVAKGHVDVAKLYIDAGGNVHTRDCFGQTGMHLCAMRGTLETAAALDIAGLELSGQDDEGDQPIRTAEMNEHHELVNFFKGEEHLPKIQDFLDNVLPMVREKLNPSKLREVRHSGNDSVRHVVDTVRGLSIDINQLLKDVGSGPVLEESQAEYIPLPT